MSEVFLCPSEKVKNRQNKNRFSNKNKFGGVTWINPCLIRMEWQSTHDLWRIRYRGKLTISTRRAFKKAGLPWAGFHSLRHHAACELLNNGVSLEFIQQFMGHDDFRSTLIYARVKRDNLKEAVVKAFDQGRG